MNSKVNMLVAALAFTGATQSHSGVLDRCKTYETAHDVGMIAFNSENHDSDRLEESLDSKDTLRRTSPRGKAVKNGVRELQPTDSANTAEDENKDVGLRPPCASKEMRAGCNDSSRVKSVDLGG